MGVRLLSVDGGGDTCLFDSVTMTAFGPVASEDALNQFVNWLDKDARTYNQAELERNWDTFRDEHPDLFV